MIGAMAVGEVRPGYELWHPNREKPEVVATKHAITFLLLAIAVVAALVAIVGWPLLDGGAGMGAILLIIAGLYALFAYRASLWSRGVLPVAAALSMLLAIFCLVGFESWFSRDKAGFDEGLVSSSLVGLLVVILFVLQLVLIAAAFYGFNQDWHVEEERPIGSGEDYGAGAPPDRDEFRTA